MPAVTIDKAYVKNEPKTATETLCYHCGIPCSSDAISIDDKAFCCDGCKLVYEIINENGLCDYYTLQSHPGLAQVKAIRNDKFSYLDNEEIADQLYKFTNGDHTIVTFYIPGVHCTSCMWLLEHLNRLNEGISESRLNFSTKEVTIHFSRSRISLRKIVELLATIGYEPYISLDDTSKQQTKTYNKQRIYKLGVAGFCFGNIMMMSFPEYLSQRTGIEEQYTSLFRYLNLLLALPVFFYAASEFFVTAWKGLRQRTLNIDAPIALAIIITFVRSVYEIGWNVGAGYLDSMSGIVFFMLVGRLVQERTYKSLSFTRDYKSYFPIAVNVVTKDGVVSKKLQDLKEKDVVQLHHDELIPADSVLLRGVARIDYSFVTGESEPVSVAANEKIYAGGKQTGEQITIQVIKPVAGSYLTSLWNHHAFKKDKESDNDNESVVHKLSKYFTVILFVLAAATAVYWWYFDPSMIVDSVSAMLIIACPCALLLSATFTNGNIMRILSNNGMFLRDATVIEQLGKSDSIVFDKTGTITHGAAEVVAHGHQLSEQEKDMLYTVASQSTHPYSRAIIQWLGERKKLIFGQWKEVPGQGVEAVVDEKLVLVGSGKYVGVIEPETGTTHPAVYARIGDAVTAFVIKPAFRKNVSSVLANLKNRFQLSLLSGDNDRQREDVERVFGQDSRLLFSQQPVDKLNYIDRLQRSGRRVIMIGDGLNDAGALQQSNVGITLADDVNNFTPSCDAILDAKRLEQLPAILKLATASGAVMKLSFVVSVVYNVIGLYLAMMGVLTPVIAAILMPCSTISIVIITTGVSSLIAYRQGLRLSEVNS